MFFSLPENEGVYQKFGFGPICRNHTFTTEGLLSAVICSVFRFGGMTAREALRLRQLSSEWRCVVDGWFLASSTTPSLQVQHRPQQKSLCQARLAHLLMLAFRCDLTPGVLVRALGPALHGDHRIASLAANSSLFRKILTPELYQHLHRVLKIGAPHRLVEHGSWENREAFVAAGNHRSAKKGAQLLDDCANKDERSLHALALPAWANRFLPHLQCSPMAVLEKPGKNPRPIFDGCFRPGLDYFSVNDVTDVSDEWVITYGTAAASYLLTASNYTPAIQVLLLGLI